MKIFSTLQAKVALLCAALAFAGAASSQTMQVNGTNCAAASVSIAQGIVNLVVPQNCAGTTAIAPMITSFSPPNGTAGAAYASYSFVATGSPTPTWSSSGLPAGLTLSTGGVLTGTPTTAGASSVTVTATNVAGVDSKMFTLTIDAPTGPPVIAAATIPAGTINQAYNYQFTASGAQPITWALSAGSTLPNGVTLTTLSNAGILSGTPTQSGTFAFQVTATNSISTATSPIFNMTINAVASLAITAQAPSTTATAGSAYPSYTFQATPNSGLTWSVASGSLPAGLSLAPSTGVLSGTPTTAGAATFTIGVTNGTSSATSSSITITVSAGVACAPGNLSTDGFCMVDPSRSATKVVLATEPNRLSGPPAPFSPLGAYSADVATSCAASNAQLGANQGVANRWQHNVDWVAYRKGQTLEEFGIPPRHAITYRFVATNDIALPPTGEIQLAGGNSYPGSVGTYLTLSTTPCDFDVTMATTTDFSKKFCYSTQSSLRFEVTSGAATLGYCKLTPGTTYYFNLRSLDTANKVESCSQAVCGGIFQIR